MLAVQEKDRMALLFTENRQQHVAEADFLLAARLHVKYRTLQDALEAERRLHLALLGLLKVRRRLVDVVLQILLKFSQIRPAGAQDLAHLRRVENGKQQVLNRQVLMARLACPMKR